MRTILVALEDLENLDTFTADLKAISPDCIIRREFRILKMLTVTCPDAAFDGTLAELEKLPYVKSVTDGDMMFYTQS